MLFSGFLTLTPLGQFLGLCMLMLGAGVVGIILWMIIGGIWGGPKSWTGEGRY